MPFTYHPLSSSHSSSSSSNNNNNSSSSTNINAYDPAYQLSLLHFLIIHFSHSTNLIKSAIFDAWSDLTILGFVLFLILLLLLFVVVICCYFVVDLLILIFIKFSFSTILDSYGRCILHDGMRTCSKELIEFLMVCNPSNLFVQDDNGRYPIDDLKQRQRKYQNFVKQKQQEMNTSSSVVGGGSFRSNVKQSNSSSNFNLNNNNSSTSNDPTNTSSSSSHPSPPSSNDITSSPLGKRIKLSFFISLNFHFLFFFFYFIFYFHFDFDFDSDTNFAIFFIFKFYLPFVLNHTIFTFFIKEGWKIGE